jgi:MoaA/NifB/PqqE/SkfB family radical SAM enzyme
VTPEENRLAAVSAFERKELRLASYPSRITAEPTSICNLRCVMCPQAIGEVHRPKHMPAELFAKLREPLGVAQSVQLNGIGEPLASPSLWMALEDGVLSPEAHAIFNTNMTLLSGDRLRRLVDCKAGILLNVSLDAATPKTYRRIRGFDLATPLKNIRAILAARRDERHPKIMLNMTLMRENIEEAPAFVELAHALGVDLIGFWHLNHVSDAEMAKYVVSRDGWTFRYAEQGLWNYPELSNRMIREAIATSQRLGVPIEFDPSKEIFFSEDAPKRSWLSALKARLLGDEGAGETVAHCTHPWDAMLVLSNGTVQACCYSATIGDINKQSFDEIWNGDKFQKLRSDLSRNIVSPVCQGASCKYVQNSTARRRGLSGRLGSAIRRLAALTRRKA